MYEWKKLNCNKNGRERMRDFQRKQGREGGIENKLGKEGRDRKQTREGREG
jgi:hypothetical protein